MAAKKYEPYQWAAGAGATVLAWYALPDLVRSRSVRALVKTCLLGVTAVGAALVPNTWEEAGEIPARIESHLAELPAPAATAILVGAVTAMTAVTVWGEKVIFARGERRRTKGVRCAHTRQAVAIAAATAGIVLIPR